MPKLALELMVLYIGRKCRPVRADKNGTAGQTGSLQPVWTEQSLTKSLFAHLLRFPALSKGRQREKKKKISNANTLGFLPPDLHHTHALCGSFFRDVRHGGGHLPGALEAAVAGERDALLPRVHD